MTEPGTPPNGPTQPPDRPRAKAATASSFLNVAQRLGGSFGIALLNVYVTSVVRRHSVHLGVPLAWQGAELQRLSDFAMKSFALHSRAPLPSPGTLVPMVAERAVALHVNVLGFNNGFVLASLPLAMLLRRGEVAGDERPVRP